MQDPPILILFMINWNAEILIHNQLKIAWPEADIYRGHRGFRNTHQNKFTTRTKKLQVFSVRKIVRISSAH
jgi:hypothetical protein